MKDIIILWIQWAGKWTQSNKILEKYGDTFLYYDTWRVFRALKSNDNALWNYIANIMDKGLLMDDSFIMSFFDSFMFVVEPGQYMLIDGSPRQMWQMFLMIERMKKAKREFKVIFLDLPEEEAIKRLSGRIICRDCNKVFNKNVDGDLKTCPDCGGEMFQRKDDTPEAIKVRLEQYYKLTLPVVDYFEDKWLLIRIDATPDADTVFQNIFDEMETM